MDPTPSPDESSDDIATRLKELRIGTRIYLVVGILSGSFYALTAETPKTAPYRWLLLSIAVVSLVRSMWYAIQLRKSRAEGEPSASPDRSPDQPSTDTSKQKGA